LHLAPVLGVAEHPFGWKHSSFRDRLLMVDIVQEKIQRAHPLLQSLLERAPFRGRDDARHEVERISRSVRSLAVHGEGDAHTVKRALRFSRFCAILSAGVRCSQSAKSW
jgi:hypothetical protein